MQIEEHVDYHISDQSKVPKREKKKNKIEAIEWDKVGLTDSEKIGTPDFLATHL